MMTEPSDNADDAREVSDHIARLAKLLRFAAETTRLVAGKAGPREQMILGLAGQIDDVADALAVIGLVDLGGKNTPHVL